MRNFQKFETFICAFEVRQRALEQVLQLRATCGAEAASRRAPGARRRGARPRRRPSRSPPAIARPAAPRRRARPRARWHPAAPAARTACGAAARGKACAGLPGAGTPADCASNASARLQNVHRGSCSSRPSSVSVVLLASKATWQLARVKCSVSLATALRHTLPRRARAPCRVWCAWPRRVPDQDVCGEGSRS